MPDLAQVSFSHGEVSPIAASRTDASFYQNSLSLCNNFFIRAEGAASNRPGTQFITQCASNTPYGSYLLPFVYSNVQSYIAEFAAGTTNIYSNGNPVQTGITNPYAIADLPNLRWAQSADVMDVTVATTPVHQLTRVTSASFTFTAPTLLNGPFQDINTDGTTTVYASGTQGTVTITASKGIFLPTHVGALFTIQEQFLSSINPWEAQRILFQGTNTPIGVYCRSDSKVYQCVNAKNASTATSTGTFQPVHTSGTQQDGDGTAVPSFADVVGVSWQFVSTNAGVAQITGYISPTQVTAVVQSDKGVYSNFPPTVVGGPVTVKGPFTYTGTGSQKTFTGLTAITVGDPNQFYVTVGGIFSDPTTYEISLSGTSITFNSAPANGAAISVAQVVGTLTQPQINNATTYVPNSPLAGLCLSTYWAFGSFSQVQGYPSCVVYFNDRKVFAGTQLQPQSAFTSIVSNYIDFGVSNPVVDSDGITFTMNARRQEPICDLIPLSDLIIGTSSTMWRVTHSSGVGAITPNDISLLPQNFYGQHPVPSVQTGDTVIYPQWGGRKVRDLAYSFQTDKFQGNELTVFARQMFPYGTQITRMAYAPEPYGLLYCVRTDGVMCVCTYLPEQQVTAWTRYTTQGFFEDVCVIPENGTFAVYVIVRRLINGTNARYIERFAPREYSTPLDAFFVDSGLTYDGRNTTTNTMLVDNGTTWLANDTGTLSCTGTPFATTDVTYRNGIWLFDSSGSRYCRLQIIAFISTSEVTVKFLDPVPLAAQRAALTTWTFARTVFGGLSNLIGKSVSVYADGAVVPPQLVDSTGTLTLPNAQGVVHAGLGFVSQMQSMQFNIQGQPTIRNHSKTVNNLACVVDQSAPFNIGPSFDNLVPMQNRQWEPYGAPVLLSTGLLSINMPTGQDDDQTVCIQMSDPAPLTILSWVASVEVGEPA